MNFTTAEPRVRDTIDQWPVTGSGLSPRVVHCMEHADVKTIGELRRWSDDRLLALRHFGTTSLENVKWFFRQTRRLERDDRRQFPDFRAVLDAFLNKQEIFVLERRYGLLDPLFRPHMRRQTLQSIADELGGMTRERVRQVEEQGLLNLQSRLCRELVKPLVGHWVSAIQQRGEVITSEELAEWTTDAHLGGCQPWGLMLLVSEISDEIHLHFDYFSTLTPKALGRIETQVIELLQAGPGLVPYAEIRERLRPSINDPHAQLDRVLQVAMGHHPDICGTQDDQYFLPAIGTPLVISKIFEKAAQPMHFRDLTAEYNQRMLPHSRKGHGFVLRTLTLMPEVERVDRAVYQLATA